MINLRGFKISFLSPTNFRGSRVKIEDLRHEKTLIIPYDYEFNNIKEIAELVLKERGIKVKYSCESKEYYILLTDNFETQLK